MGTAPETTIDGARLRPLAWLAVALGVLAVGAGVALVTLVEGSTDHESSATLLIDQPRALSVATDSGLIDKLGRLRFKYAGLVTTAQFAEPVAEEVGLPEPMVRGALFSRVDPASLLLEVGARGSDREAVRDIADAAADALVEYVADEQSEAGVPSDDRFVMSVVTPAAEGRPLPDPTDRYGIAAAVAGALLLLVAVAALFVLPRRR